MAKAYDILSPDGFSISATETWNTPEEAETAFIEWVKRFERQGYYSSNRGRIELSELRKYCKLIPIEIE